MPTGDRNDPYTAFNFLVDLGIGLKGGFTEASGLSVQIEVESIKEGGVNDFEHKLFKGIKYSDITLKRGLIDWELWNWCEDVINGKIERKNGVIYLQDRSGNNIKGWSFYDAIPIKWEGPTFNASSNNIASETLVLAHRGISKVTEESTTDLPSEISTDVCQRSVSPEVPRGFV